VSGDRTAFFYINLSAVFVIFLSQKLFKLRLIILLSSILLIVVISVINPTAKERLIDYTLTQMNVVKETKREHETVGRYIFSMQHNHHYLTAYKMFLDNKILGVGVKNFRNFCNDEKYKVSRFSCSTHPHNSYLQILTEIGMIGFLFLMSILLVFCGFIFKHMLLKKRGKYYFTDFEICVLSGIAIYLWPFIPTGNVFNNWLNITMILNLPFLIWSRKLTKTKKS
jgi:O-antigen ligase